MRGKQKNDPRQAAKAEGVPLADEFDREAAMLGASDKFISFLEARSKETEDIPFQKVREKRGM